MKTNAIIRIVILSIVLVVLLGILLAGLGFKSFIARKNSEIRWETSHSPAGSSENTFSDSFTASTGLRDIEIQWVAGTITVQAGDVDQVTYQETEVSDSKYKMIARESSDDLKIIYCDENIGFSFSMFGANIDVIKDLTIIVPRDMNLESLEIDAASAEVIIRDLTIHEVSLDTASGKCQLDGCSIGELDIDTASGDIRFNGSLDMLDFDAASAEFEGILTNTPRSIKVDSLSGDIDITLPSDAGFTVSTDAMSSDFSSDFETTIRNGEYICGDGSCKIEYSGMSGDITIRKGN